MAKLADAPDLGSGAARRGGSSPSIRTTLRTVGFGWFMLPSTHVAKPVSRVGVPPHVPVTRGELAIFLK